jgi:NADH-quinone oxidoreductase subunit G
VKRGAKVFRIGPPVDLTYPVTDLGTDSRCSASCRRTVRDAFTACRTPP